MSLHGLQENNIRIRSLALGNVWEKSFKPKNHKSYPVVLKAGSGVVFQHFTLLENERIKNLK